MLQSQVAWLGMLGELTEAVRDEDWPRARHLAARRITFPQPYPEPPESGAKRKFTTEKGSE